MAFLKSKSAEYAFLVLVLFIGFSLTAASALTYQGHYNATVRASFEDAANDRIDVLKRFVEYSTFTLTSVNALYLSSDEVSYSEFISFTTPLMENHPYINSIGWISYVSRNDRKSYEHAIRKDFPAFTITQKSRSGEFIEEPLFEDYYPLTYANPARNMAHGLGYDIAKDPERGATLLKAITTKQPQITGRLTLLNPRDSSHGEGVTLLSPVYKKGKIAGSQNNESYEYIQGLVSTSISLYSLIETALAPLQPRGVNIVVQDLSEEKPENRIPYVRSTRLKTFSTQEILKDMQNEKVMSLSSDIDIAGRKWRITVLQASGFFQAGISGITYATLCGGALFTLLLAFYILSTMHENARISRQVLEQTETLRQAKRETELILLSTHEGIIGVSQKGKITFCNPHAAALLGYAQRKLIGEDYHSVLKPSANGASVSPETCSIRRVLEEGQPCNSSENCFTSKKGTTFPVEVSVSPVIDDSYISGAVIVFHDISDRKKYEERLRQMAQYDHLTGLCNRHYFMDLLDMAIKEAGMNKKKLAVIYFDLNGFKKINDAMGHAAGDEMLKAFAQHLKRIYRSDDVSARLGGDEFVVLAEGLNDESECLRATDRLLASFMQQPVMIAGAPHHLSASIGIAFYPDAANSPDELIRCADAAMYKAKKEKSRKYEIYKKPLPVLDEKESPHA